jgi:hypothetical protein
VKIDSLAPTFLGASAGSTSNPTPANVKQALIHVVCAYFKKLGIITDAALQASIPDVDPSTHVPVPLAMALQLFAPFTSPEGGTLSFTDSSAAMMGIAASGNLSTGAADAGYSPINVNPTVAGTYELEATNGAATASWAALFKISDQILNNVAAVGVPSVQFGKIKLTAPEGSAYANYNITYSSVASPTRKFDPDVAFLWGQSGFPFDTSIASYRAPLPVANSTSQTRGTVNFNLGGNPNNLSIGWIETLFTCEYAHAPVKNVLAKSKLGKLRTFIIEVLDMCLYNWHSFIALSAARMVATGTITTAAQVYAFAVAMDSALLARLSEYGYLIAAGRSNRLISPAFRTMVLPPAAAFFVTMLGPVIFHGRLRLVLPFVGSGGYIAASSTTTAFQSVGDPTLPFSGIFATPAAAQNYVVQGVTYSAGNFPLAMTNYPITPYLQADGFINLASLTSAVGNPFKSGVSADVNRSLGGIPNFAFVIYGTLATSASSFVVAATTFTRYFIPITGMCADVGHAKIDLTLSFLMGLQMAPANRTGLSYQSDVLQEVIGLLGAIVASQETEDFTMTMGEVRANLAKLRSLKGEDYDAAMSGNALFAGLASVFAPLLANAAPNIIKFVKDKFLGSAPSNTDTEYAVLGDQIGNNAELARMIKSAYNSNARKHDGLDKAIARLMGQKEI